MAIINSYPLDTSISDNDILLGVDSANSNITKTYSIGSLRTFINSDGGVIVDTNYYLDGITTVPATGAVTFSINGATNQVLNLGTAAFLDSDEFAEIGHSHTLSSIVPNNGITTTYLDVDSTGTVGEILTSDGLGGFTWASASSIVDTNNYLTGITKSGNTLTFAVSGEVADPTYTFGEAAFLSINTVIAQVAAGIDIADIDTSLGQLAALDAVGINEISSNSVSTEKLQQNAVTEEKLKISNNPLSGYVLTSDGAAGFTWAFNSASNYYLSNITKSSNKLTFEMSGGLGASSFASYTFGDAAFKSVGTTAGTIAGGDHTHLMASISNAGALATLNTIATSEINNNAVTLGKLSPAPGSNGQFLTISGGALAWETIATASVNFLTLSNTPNTFSGHAGKILKVNSGEDALEFTPLSILPANISTTNSAASGKVLSINSNGNLEWILQGSGGTIISPTNLNGIVDNGTNTQLIQTDGDGTFSYVNFPTIFDGQFSSLTGKPTTIAGYGITDAFNGQFSSLTSKPTTIAGYNITDAFDGQFSSLTNKPTTISGYGITDAFNGQFSSLTSKPTTIAGYGITDAVTSINGLSDVDTVSENVAEGKVLAWKAATSKWEPAVNAPADNTVGVAELDNRFKTISSLFTLSSGSNFATLDWSTAVVFLVTLPSDATFTTLAFSNQSVGLTKIIKMTGKGGTGTITIPGTKLNGTIDYTNNTVNYIQVTCIGPTEYIYTIAQAG